MSTIATPCGSFLLNIVICYFYVCHIACDELIENSGGAKVRVRRIVGGEPAVPPSEDAPVVFTRFSGKTASILGSRDVPHYVFKGIRFGLPPIGKDRFLRPRQYLLNGFENATRYPPPCVQPVPNQNMIIGREDCLFLNVFTPTLPTGMEGLPVIVWIHGGGFRYGSASQYGVSHLVGKRVVVVTLQYRLGSLGFLSADSKEMPGNAGLWDMVLAVQWVRNYIGFFGGNPYRIVVMGHGSGASSAMLVALSNVAKGLSSGIVAMSGTSVSHFATDDSPQDTAREIADINGCPVQSPLTMVRCLQNLSPAAIIRGDSAIEFQRISDRGFVSGLGGRLNAAPVTEGRWDGRSLPGLVENEPMKDLAAADNRTKKIPLLTGITRDETRRACNSQYKHEIVNKLQTIPNFLDKVLVTNLQKAIGLDSLKSNNKSTQLLNALDPLHFRGYLQVKKNDFTEGLSKISEATGDALFNVPAFLTAESWSRRGASAFLYRFDHVGGRKKGNFFLRGLPLVGNSTSVDTATSNDTVGHGDELAYLFDVQDLEGRSMESSSVEDAMSADDRKVREFFTQMVADFARFGHVTMGKDTVKPFSGTENNFIQILPRPKVANNFRFCEMALWVGLAQRLQSSSCQFLKVLDTNLQNVGQFFDTVSHPGAGAGSLGNLGHLLGGHNGNKSKNGQDVVKQPPKTPNLGGLFNPIFGGGKNRNNRDNREHVGFIH